MILPPEARLIGPRDTLGFLHSRSVELPGPITALEAWRRVMARPFPGIGLAFWLRDAISARFGVARIGGFSGTWVGQVRPGDHLDFFLVEAASDRLLALTARDIHLDVMIAITAEDRRVGITASVRPHNAFGRAYMIPVAPAHRLIVWWALRQIRGQHPA